MMASLWENCRFTDFKHDVRFYTGRSEKSPQLGERHAASNGETFLVVHEIDFAESIPVTDLPPEVELMHSLRMRRQLLSCLKQSALDRLPSSLERYLVKYLSLQPLLAKVF